MNSVPYASVLEQASILWTGQAEPGTDEAAELNAHINRRAASAWRRGWWTELMRVERRTFRPVWSSTATYAATDEIYYPPTGQYYQSLHGANTGNAPADADDETDDEHWADCASHYSGDDYASGTHYVPGDVVLYPVDDEYYSCYVEHDAGAAIDLTKFGRLTPFIRSIDPEAAGETRIGAVRAAWRLDPNHHPDADRLEIEWVGSLLLVRGHTPRPWIEFRLPVPSWTGDAWASGTTYALDDQVWDATSGDYYRSLAGANTGNAVTDAAWWERIELPAILAEAVAQGAAADALRADGRGEIFPTENALAEQWLLEALTENDRRSGTARHLPVRC